MKTALAIAVGVALVTGRASALDPWTWQDSAWEAASLTAIVADWGTTRDGAWKNDHLARSGRRYPAHIETNPILGRDPSPGRVDAYFVSALLVHAGVAAVLPGRWRRAWQASTLTLELGMVNGNYHANLSVRF
jgi:hypothetical protein